MTIDVMAQRACLGCGRMRKGYPQSGWCRECTKGAFACVYEGCQERVSATSRSRACRKHYRWVEKVKGAAHD